ncbi:tRNA 4-thiouridine(8) synthase ThiI, partial [Candidatus Gracilibacteria bacterium]|nr:tRNA 4-thiouridine(8) synthase ThiI [Candidatus Gracilibacteria bacterium]
YSIEDCISQDEIFDTIFQKTKEIHLSTVDNKSFVVRIRRTGLHNFTSTEIERYIGGGLLQHGENCRVQLKNPEVTIKLEIRDKLFHVIKEQIQGTGGYPIGFQEKVLSLISGGFDSGVSSYSMMKRGCQVDYLFFNLGGSAHELGVKQVAYYLWKTFSIPHKKARFITVNFEEIMEQLLVNVNHKFRGIILKRYMLKVASLISENNYYALVKGDSLGQVSSQTLKNMHVVDKASDALVLRPLIADNKQEIVDVSMKIGTYNFACNMPEYCGTISDKPSTGAKLEDILEEEKNIDESILTKAFESRTMEFIKDLTQNNEDKITNDVTKVTSIEEGQIVVDVREEDMVNKKPLKIESEKIEIPFFQINSKFSKLDQNKTYLFYCDKGILSELHALYLQEKGFTNIKVFRPQ